MKIRIGKMILHGIIVAIFYLGIPYGVLFALDYYGILALNMDFIYMMIPFAIAGIVISMLKVAYPKDTVANSLLMFLITVYSGIFLFYFFGGFNPGVDLGNFSITKSIDPIDITILIGVKIIAYLCLANACFNGLRYLFEAYEIHKQNKAGEPRKGKFKWFRVFKGFSSLTSLVLLAYIISLLASGSQLRPNLNPSAGFYWDQNGTPGVYGDDNIGISILFSMDNGGIYAIRDINLDVEIWTLNNSSPPALIANTKVGGILNSSLGNIPSFSKSSTLNITILIDTPYILGMLQTNVKLNIIVDFSCWYGGMFLEFKLELPYDWSHLI